MLMMAGTIRNNVKMAQLDNQWQQKKENGNIFKKEMTAQEMQLMQFKEDIQKMREGDQMNSISSKLTSGMELTPEEIEYLQKNAPQLYQEYVKLKQEKQAYERQLKNCKTKEDVNRLKVNKMNSFLSEAKTITNNPNIPKGKKKELLEKILMRTTGVEKIHQKFIASGRYEALPTEQEKAEEAKEKAEQTASVAQEEKNEDTILKEEEEVIPDSEDKNLQSKESKPEGAEPQKTERKENKAVSAQIKEVNFSDIYTEIAEFMKSNGQVGFGHEYQA